MENKIASVQCNCTDDMVKIVDGIVKKVGVNNITEVRLRISEGNFPKITIPEEEWPLKVTVKNGKGNDGVIYLIGGIMAGYKGQGPLGTIKAIKTMGFNLSPEDEKLLLSKKTIYMLLKKAM